MSFWPVEYSRRCPVVQNLLDLNAELQIHVPDCFSSVSVSLSCYASSFHSEPTIQVHEKVDRPSSALRGRKTVVTHKLNDGRVGYLIPTAHLFQTSPCQWKSGAGFPIAAHSKLTLRATLSNECMDEAVGRVVSSRWKVMEVGEGPRLIDRLQLWQTMCRRTEQKTCNPPTWPKLELDTSLKSKREAWCVLDCVVGVCLQQTPWLSFLKPGVREAPSIFSKLGFYSW